MAPDYFDGLAWAGPETLVSTQMPGLVDPGAPSHLVRIDLGSHDVVPLSPPSPSKCFRTQYVNPTSLRTGEVGVVEACTGTEESGGRDTYRLRAIDVATSEARKLVTPFSLGTLNSFTYPRISVNRDETEALIAAGNLECRTIADVDAGGASPLNVVVDASSGWSLADGYLEADGCSGVGLADLPVWSPDGHRFAFFASPEAMRVSAGSRDDAEWNLYSSATTGDEAQMLLEGVVEPRALAWGRDGTIAFSAEDFGGSGGTWLYDPESGALSLLSDRVSEALAWSPDGERLAALMTVATEGLGFDEKQLVMFEPAEA